MRHFLDILDHSTEELEAILARAALLKRRLKSGIHDRRLTGKCLGMIFEKPSLRTRVSLEAAIASMGGTAIELQTMGMPLDARESLADQARTLSRYVHIIAVRCFGHHIVETLAKWSAVPVINALSDYSHPTQALADILTLREHVGDLGGRVLAFVGDGNNVARSLAGLCAKLGITFAIASPPAYDLDGEFLQRLRHACPSASLRLTSDPAEAVRDASAIYTDVWASMGQEKEAQTRREIFRPYQVNAALLSKAPSGVKVMHCLPAHRGEEITDEVIDSPAAIVFDQAENRMHINRALFDMLVADC